jgi:prephenate dehydratase
MNSYPAPALALVRTMTLAANEKPAKAIAFQGAPGANSHLAALEYDADCLPLPCFSFEDAIDAVKDGSAARAIIPIENSLHGRVADIHFLLPESGLSIIAEHFMPIRHCLMAKSADAELKTALSHLANAAIICVRMALSRSLMQTRPLRRHSLRPMMTRRLPP